MKKLSHSLLAASFFCLTVTSQAGIILSEGFNNISTLSGSGWALINNSVAIGTTGWFQGDPTSIGFNAQAGAANSFISANFNNAAFGGNISNWLILPNMTLSNGDTLTFFTRTETAPVPGDVLEVRLSGNGASTNVGVTATSIGDFTTLLTTVGTVAYPQNWTQISVIVSGLAGPTSARLAFRYVVSDTSANGDIIAIDSVTVDSTSAIPEPGTMLTLSAGLLLLAVGNRARRRL